MTPRTIPTSVACRIIFFARTVTVDDPKAYTKPWTVNLRQRIVVGTELIDEICLENEQSLKHMK